MAKNIKNYTSAVPVERTIASIEQELVKIGVQTIVKNYDAEGLPSGIFFSVVMPDQRCFGFQIPAKIDAALDIIKDVPAYKKKNKEWLKAQSRRTAWKIVLMWVESQVAMIQLSKFDAMQMFMQFAYDPVQKKTFYEKVSGNNFKMLSE